MAGEGVAQEMRMRLQVAVEEVVIANRLPRQLAVIKVCLTLL